MLLAQKYKKREDALEWLNQLLHYFHTQLSEPKSQANNKIISLLLKHLLASYQEIQQNLNPQLLLEHYLFKIANGSN